MDEEGRAEGRELLREYCRTGREGAFRGLVEAFGGMVHGVALRRTGDRDAAEEVAQRVFIALARKAERVAQAGRVGAWLHRAAVLESLKVMRERRRTRERLAMIREEMASDEQGSAGWKEVLPHLDEAFDRLKEGEREVLMLHYVEGRSFPEVGAQLSVSAEAARKRSERALARLAEFLRGRGVVVPAAVVASALTAEFGKAAPAGLVGPISAAAMGARATVVSSSLWQTILTAMQTGKLSIAAAVLVGAAIPVGIEVVKRNEEGRGAAAKDGARMASGGPGRKSPRAGAGSTARGEERLRAVFERMEAGEEADHELELALRRLVYTLDATELEVARALLEEVEKYERFREIAKAVFGRWAELDPEAAIAEASREVGRYGYYPLHGAFGTRTAIDREAALQWLVTAETPFDLRFMGYEWLRRSVREDGEAGAILEGMAAGKTEWSDEMHRVLVDAWGKHDPEAALEWVMASSGEQREELLEGLVKSAGELTPEIALQAADRMQNRGRKLKALWEVVWWWALGRPDDLIRFGQTNERFGAFEPETLRAIGEGLARNRPQEVTALGEVVGDGLRRDAFWSGVLRGVVEADPIHFVVAAEAISEEYVEREASGDFVAFVRSWSERDAGAARAWAEALPEGPKRRHANMALHLASSRRATEGTP